MRIVGREREREAILRGLQDRGLVALVGIAGAGKTCLARAWATRAGATWVAAGDCRSAAELVATVAQAYRLAPEPGGSPLERVVEAVRAAGKGLALDQLEGVEGAADVLRELRAGGPIVATSRAPLDALDAEVVPVVPLRPADARSLLALRAPEWADDPDLVTLAAALDHIPLALELAAAHATWTRPGELVRHLVEAGLGALDGVAELAGWTYDHLPPDLREAWSALAVCRGGFTLDTARALRGPGALREVAELVRRGVAVPQPSTAGLPSRWAFPEVVRELGESRAPPELRKAAEVAHGRHFVAAFDGVAANLGPAEVDRLAAEQWNLKAGALRLAESEPGLVAQLALRLSRFSRLCSTFEDGWRWLELGSACAERAGDVEVELRLRVQRSVSASERSGPDRAAAEALWERAEQAPPSSARASALRESARQLVILGAADADERLRRAAHEAWTSGDVLVWADLEGTLAERALGGAPERAVARVRELLDEVGPHPTWSRLGLLLRLARLQQADHPDEAVASAREAYACADGMGPVERAYAANSLGVALCAAGQPADAAEALRPAVEAAKAAGLAMRATWLLAAVGWAELAAGDVARAAATLEGVTTRAKRYRLPAVAAIAARDLAVAALGLGDARSAAEHLDRAGPGELAYDHGVAAVVARARGDHTRWDEARAACAAAARSRTDREILAVLDGLEEPACAEGWVLVRARLAADRLRRPAWVASVDLARVIAPDGALADLSTRPLLRRVLGALVAHHRDQPGEELTVEALFAAGWPGDRATPESGAARVYVAIGTLRKAGLDALIQRGRTGYRLDPAVRVEVG